MNQRIGSPARVLSGVAAGHIGTIVSMENNPSHGRSVTMFRVEFNPPIYKPAAGWVKAVWRSAVDLEWK